MNDKQLRNHRITFRMNDSEYERVIQKAAKSQEDLSSFVRNRVAYSLEHVVHDNALVTELREYRAINQSLAQNVAAIRQRIDEKNSVQVGDLAKINALVRSVYHKLEEIEQSINTYRKEIMNGNY